MNFMNTKVSVFRMMYTRNKHRVLNYSHTDLDGVCAAIVVKNVLPNAIFRQINYGALEEEEIAYLEASHDEYDAVIFTDYCPSRKMVDVLQQYKLNYLVLDHHKTATIYKVQYGAYCIDQTKCGAAIAYDFFQRIPTANDRKTWMQNKDLEHLVELANDHDMWLHNNPQSIQLNRLYYLYPDAHAFLDAFLNGVGEHFNESDQKQLDELESSISEYISGLTFNALPDNGYYVECDHYIGDVSMKLDTMCQWYVMVNRSDETSTKLSFRCRVPGIDVGSILKDIGRGGGGHPAAAGQGLPPDEDWLAFINMVHDLMFKNNNPCS